MEDAVIEYKIPEELIGDDGFVEVDNTIQCANILMNVPNVKLKSKNKELQERIELYNKCKNVAIFLSPLKSEREDWLK